MHPVKKSADRKIFKRTASRTRKENIPSKIMPRGGVRH